MHRARFLRSRSRSSDVECAEPPPEFRRGGTRRPVHVSDPGELIVGIPAMLGFVPQRSVVVLVLQRAAEGTMVDAVVRFDLDRAGGRRVSAATLSSYVRQVCAQADTSEVLTVVVDDRTGRASGACTDMAGQDASGRAAVRRSAALVAEVARRVGAHGIHLAGAWTVPAIEAGQPWRSMSDPNQLGTLRDPATSVVTLSHVLDGRLIRSSRAELGAVVAIDPEFAEEVSRHLDGALVRARQRRADASHRDDADGHRKATLRHVLSQVAATESGTEFAPIEIANIAVALRDRCVRDVMFALAGSDHAAAAERLWAAMTRSLKGPDRAEAAALLGYSAYARGDGTLAGIALEVAIAAMPDHSMAVLLDTSLRSGMRPEQIRRLAQSGRRIATGLGVDLGPIE